MERASVRGLGHQVEAFWKQQHHHHEALRAAESVKGKLYLGMKTTNVLGHVDEFSRKVAGVGARCNGLYSYQDDPDYVRGSVSGLRSENY